MEKILSCQNIKTCMFSCIVFHLVPPFTPPPPHYSIMLKGLLQPHVHVCTLCCVLVWKELVYHFRVGHVQ